MSVHTPYSTLLGFENNPRTPSPYFKFFSRNPWNPGADWRVNYPRNHGPERPSRYDRDDTRSDYEKLEEFLLDHFKVYYIRLQWVDYSGVLRAQFILKDRGLRIADQADSASMAQAGMLIPISTAPKPFPTSGCHERWSLRPDWSSLRLCGFKANHASVMCQVDQDDAATRFDTCPRHTFRQALDHLETRWGAKVRMGVEIEFVLLDESYNRIKSLDQLTGYASTAGLRAENLEIMEEIMEGLFLSGVLVHHFHSEGDEQLEIALGHQSALEAIDSLILAEENIRTVCSRRGYKASLAPKPALDGEQNGLHLHFSIDQLRKGTMDQFLAGLLCHMTSLCALGMANHDSYGRAMANCAGEWIGYGSNNRDLPIRQISERHFEVRAFDATANPYLFAAGVLWAGIDGLEKEMELTWKNVTAFPSLLDADGRFKMGITQRMPHTLTEALDGLEQDTSLRAKLGEVLMARYLSIKRKEVEVFGAMSDEERRLLFVKYF